MMATASSGVNAAGDGQMTEEAARFVGDHFQRVPFAEYVRMYIIPAQPLVKGPFGAFSRRTGRQNARHGRKTLLPGAVIVNGQRVMPSAEHAAPFWGRRAQVLDWFIIRGENALCFDAHYAARIAAITNYDGAGPPAMSLWTSPKG